MAAETVRERQAIVGAIVRHDARAARGMMRQHRDRTHNRYVKEWGAGNYSWRR